MYGWNDHENKVESRTYIGNVTDEAVTLPLYWFRRLCRP